LRNRILRIEEVKRLQTFPDSWQLAGSVGDQWRQLGNAVPPRLAYHLGKALAEQLNAQVRHRLNGSARPTTTSAGARYERQPGLVEVVSWQDYCDGLKMKMRGPEPCFSEE
jgi:hypothetical protein